MGTSVLFGYDVCGFTCRGENTIPIFLRKTREPGDQKLQGNAEFTIVQSIVETHGLLHMFHYRKAIRFTPKSTNPSLGCQRITDAISRCLISLNLIDGQHRYTVGK